MTGSHLPNNEDPAAAFVGTEGTWLASRYPSLTEVSKISIHHQKKSSPEQKCSYGFSVGIQCAS